MSTRLLTRRSNMFRMAGMPSLPLLTSGRLSSSDWAETLLLECAGAISDNDLPHAQQLLWVLNELSSPYGSHEQRLAYYFMQALFCKISGTGPHTHISLCAAAERSSSFESIRKTMLKFQEASPWVTFGHVAANGAIMEALEGESSVHIIDLSTTFCTQWPTLLEALATRAEGAPNVRLTTVVFNEAGVPSSFASMNVMEEVGIRLEKFARLMGVPFQFNLVNHTELHSFVEQVAGERWAGGLHYTDTHQTTTEALAINCISSMHRIAYSQRQALLCKLQSLNPKIFTLVEDEAHIVSAGSSFTESFSEALRFYALFFDALEGSMGKASGERVAIERGASRRIMRMVGCEEEQEGACTQYEKRESGDEWRERLLHAGFVPKGFSDDAVDDVKALLKRYKEGWGLVPPLQPHSPSHDHRLDGITLTWKDQAVISASAWRSF